MEVACNVTTLSPATVSIVDVTGEDLHIVSSANCANPFLYLLDTASFDMRFSPDPRYDSLSRA
jgi:hypothetical protein